MKKILFLLGLLCVGTVAAANDDKCRSIYRHAEITMDQRQNGVTLVHQLQTVDGLELSANEKSFKDLLYVMIEEAYEQSRYNSEKIQQEVTQEFAAKWYLRCIRGNR